LFRPKAKKKMTGTMTVMMTARGFRRSRRISRLNAVRLKPPKRGARRPLRSGTDVVVIR
jgi:hypothetical protein